MKNGPYLAMARGPSGYKLPERPVLSPMEIYAVNETCFCPRAVFPGNGLVVDPAMRAPSRSAMASISKSAA